MESPRGNRAGVFSSVIMIFKTAKITIPGKVGERKTHLHLLHTAIRGLVIVI